MRGDSKFLLALFFFLYVFLGYMAPPSACIRVDGKAKSDLGIDGDFERYAARSSRSGLASARSRRGGGRLLADTPSCNGTICGTFCTSTDEDPNNCGTCFTFCAPNEVCCGGKCTTKQSDPINCGECGKRCPGTCALGLCDYGGGSP